MSSDRASFSELAATGSLIFGDGYRTKASELGQPGYPILRVAQVADGRVTSDGVRDWVKTEFGARMPGKLSQEGDVVLTTKGTFGRRARIDSSAAGWIYSPQVCYFRVRDASRIDPGYLYSWLGSNDFLDQARGRASQTDMADYLSLRDLGTIQLPLPTIGEQRAIAHILGTLDDKLELNRRMSETLEAMARALFQSWFVDFDPVRAKAEGCDPGLPSAIAVLFPDAFEESELGEIPKGWGGKRVGDLADVFGGTTPSTKEPTYWEGGVHAWATPKDLSGVSVPVLVETERRLTDAGLAQVGSGLLPKGTVLLSSRAPIGYLAIAELPVAVNQGFIAMVAKEGISNLFLLLWASAAHDDIVSRANGSTFLEISKSNFRPIPVVTPSATVMQAFEGIQRPQYERIVRCVRENQSLAALRDTLLPKLISGELRVGDAERIVGSVA